MNIPVCPDGCPGDEPQLPTARSGRCPHGHSGTPERRGHLEIALLAFCFGSGLVVTLADMALGASMPDATVHASNWVLAIGGVAVLLRASLAVPKAAAATRSRAKRLLAALNVLMNPDGASAGGDHGKGLTADSQLE